MGWKDKAKSGGGATTEGKITDYSFTNYFPLGDDPEPGDNIYLKLELTPDGADAEPTIRPLYLGSGNYLVICDEDGEAVEAGKDGLLEGKILKGGEDGEVDEDSIPRLYAEGAVFAFISSMEDLGFPAEDKFPDPEEDKVLDFRGMLGWRIRMGTEQDVKGQLAAGKKALGAKANGKTEAEILEAGRRKVTKGKHKGKSFNLTRDVVTKVFGPDEKPSKAAKDEKPARGAGKSKKAAEPEEEEESGSSWTPESFLVAAINAQPKKSLDGKSLQLLLTRFAAKQKIKSDERDELVETLTGDGFVAKLAKKGVVEVDKKGIITAADAGDDDDADEDEE